MNIKYNLELSNIIKGKQSEWATNIKDLTPLLRTEPHNMTDANALALSYRAMVLEEVNYFSSLFADFNKEIKILKKDKFIFYATGLLPDGTKPKHGMTHPLLGRKMSKTEYDTVISGDLSEQEHTLQLINDMVDFLREIIKTIDGVCFMIKNRIELFNYLK